MGIKPKLHPHFTYDVIASICPDSNAGLLQAPLKLSPEWISILFGIFTLRKPRQPGLPVASDKNLH